ncbi:intradiol ring-cleavage dioxygenase [Saccharopolyspora sp. TS4A08]|uniref:Intradiol ring-cleavage dioxygenase n=1 Tax=Saccharopolyspora ipomoeae TaxID=3042027 RepID=A0ABT6PVJ8_9PSEU|nr:intradiol ring-cleavage dioxygenase [Saccharopolyspora sp. TS4A08]MDI2032044.1 intradiol ring-cleavage dioxygenase [Saccharopolyspora sp. TS4A08]
MSPDRTPSTPTYRGRPLARPADEVVDQGLGFDLGTLMDRRRVLRIFGIGAAAAGLAACGSQASAGNATSEGEIPEETAGPYPGDGSNGPDVLERSGIVRQDIRSSFGGATGVAEGVPLTLELTISDLVRGDVPFTGVAVYVWHCTREGGYSMYSEGIEDENFLRGVQIADDQGKARFTSIFPACYDGRWPHVHFEVYPGQADITDVSKVIATSQVALPKNICDTVYAQPGYEASVDNLANVSLDGDMVFGDDGAALQLATVTGDVQTGYTAALHVAIDTSTEAGGGGTPPSR